MPIRRFLPADKSFDSEAIDAMRAAYTRALPAIGAIGERHSIQEILAKRIIKAAAEDESEPDRLCDGALASLGLKR